MPQHRLTLRAALGGTFRALGIALPGILLFEAIFKLLTMLVFQPALSGIIQWMLVLKGDSLGFNDAIRAFFLSPYGLVAGLLFVVLASVLAYFEFAVVILMAYGAAKGEKIRLRAAMAQAFTTMGALNSLGYVGFVLYAMVVLPFVSNGVASSIVPRLDIPRFVSGELMKSWYGIPLLVLVSLGAFLLAEALVLVFPTMVLRKAHFFSACKEGHALCHKNHLRIAGIVLLGATLWALLDLVPLVVQEVFFDFPYPIGYADVLLTFDFSPMSFLTLLLATVFWFTGLLLAPVLLTMLTVLYRQLGGTDTLNDASAAKVRAFFTALARPFAALGRRIDAYLRPPLPDGKKPSFGRRHLYQLMLSLVALGVVAGLLLGMALYEPPLRDYITIGHRGSTKGVENTLEAIQGAIDAKADYAEIDILLSKDKVPMVIHDSNLSRLAGKDLNVWELTAEELSAITLRQDGHTGHISTLEEMLRYAQGKIGLLIEFKQHGHERVSVVDQTMAVVQAANFTPVMFHTLLYDDVLEMKEKYPDYRTGYTVFGSIGRVKAEALSELKADFIGIEEGMMSINFIRTCDDDNLPVYVWTPNDDLDMAHYLELGASGIITDYPDIARPVVDAAKALQNERIRSLLAQLTSTTQSAA